MDDQVSDSKKTISASHVLERIAAHSAEVAKGFIVRRAVPTQARRMVGAWCLLGHAGPADFDTRQGLNERRYSKPLW